jgi:glycogen(starch) synthase
MRILVISNYYPPVELGGWEQLTCNVTNKLQERGHQMQVLTSNYLKEQISISKPNIHRSLFLESYDPQVYHPSYTLSHRWQERENNKTISNLITGFHPDIVFINGMWNLPYSIAKRAEELAPGRVAYYVASYWPTELDAHTAYWSSPAENPFRRYPKSLLAAIVKKTLLSSTPRNRLDFELVLCVSAFIRDYVVEEVGVPSETTRVVHNGIELDLFKMKSSHIKDGKLRFLYAGQLSPDKGVHTILESLAILKKNHPQLPIILSIYGSGTTDYIKRLEKLITEYQLEKWVHFKGVVPREEMPSIFVSHDVLLFPSIWAEPLARVCQEAMACGLVVIGTLTGGSGEILRDGENSLTFEAENAHMLAEKIMLVHNDRGFITRLAKAGRRTVEEEFSLERMVDEIEVSFTQLLERREYWIE